MVEEFNKCLELSYYNFSSIAYYVVSSQATNRFIHKSGLEQKIWPMNATTILQTQKLRRNWDMTG